MYKQRPHIHTHTVDSHCYFKIVSSALTWVNSLTDYLQLVLIPSFASSPLASPPLHTASETPPSHPLVYTSCDLEQTKRFISPIWRNSRGDFQQRPSLLRRHGVIATRRYRALAYARVCVCVCVNHWDRGHGRLPVLHLFLMCKSSKSAKKNNFCQCSNYIPSLFFITLDRLFHAPQ